MHAISHRTSTRADRGDGPNTERVRASSAAGQFYTLAEGSDCRQCGNVGIRVELTLPCVLTATPYRHKGGMAFQHNMDEQHSTDELASIPQVAYGAADTEMKV